MLFLLSVVLCLFSVAPARALDKQGSAHGGSLAGSSSGQKVSGSLMLGASVYNPSYAARPDNSGLALMRYAGHLDIDLIGSRLSIPLDVNFFTDRERKGALKLSPSELDLITGLTSTWALPVGAVEAGARVESDRNVDRPGGKQTYVDARVRYLYSVAQLAPGLRRALRGGDLTGWGTLGWFAYNPSYFARPDNTGKAFLRYAAHAQLSMLDGLVALGLDATFFTDRDADHVLRPSELDLTPELVLHRDAFDLHVAYENDMPVDRGGLQQRLVYLLASWSFTALELP